MFRRESALMGIIFIIGLICLATIATFSGWTTGAEKILTAALILVGSIPVRSFFNTDKMKKRSDKLYETLLELQSFVSKYLAISNNTLTQRDPDDTAERPHKGAGKLTWSKDPYDFS